MYELTDSLALKLQSAQGTATKYGLGGYVTIDPIQGGQIITQGPHLPQHTFANALTTAITTAVAPNFVTNFAYIFFAVIFTGISVSEPSTTNKINYQLAKYFISASTVEQCPPDTCLEVAFVGRSNAGKSSAINELTSQTKLARTSKTPGRTQLLNYFELAPERYLVDLPGFGYAAVPLDVKRKWQKQLEKYLEQRKSLQGLVHMMDIRHPFKEFDDIIVQWCLNADMPLHILLTKSDKLTFGAARTVLLETQKTVEEHAQLITVQLFSALKHKGVDELKARLNVWLTPATVETESDSPASAVMAPTLAPTLTADIVE